MIARYNVYVVVPYQSSISSFGLREPSFYFTHCNIKKDYHDSNRHHCLEFWCCLDLPWLPLVQWHNRCHLSSVTSTDSLPSIHTNSGSSESSPMTGCCFGKVPASYGPGGPICCTAGHKNTKRLKDPPLRSLMQQNSWKGVTQRLEQTSSLHHVTLFGSKFGQIFKKFLSKEATWKMPVPPSTSKLNPLCRWAMFHAPSMYTHNTGI